MANASRIRPELRGQVRHAVIPKLLYLDIRKAVVLLPEDHLRQKEGIEKQVSHGQAYKICRTMWVANRYLELQ